MNEIFELEEEFAAPDVRRAVAQVVRAEARQTRNLIRRIMSDTQTHLDADISALADVINALEGEIATLKAQEGPVDFTHADALVVQAKAALAGATPAPVAPPAGAATTDAAAPAQPSGTDVASAPAEVQALVGPTGDLPTATAGGGYSTTLVASGGTAPYTFAVEGLPAGLTATADGTISGTPEVRGTSSLAVTVTDAAGASVQSAPVLTAS